MKITYDSEADAAYIILVDDIAAGAAVQQVSEIASPNGDAEIVLDFDDAGHLLGIEVLGASNALAPETVARAEEL